MLCKPGWNKNCRVPVMEPSNSHVQSRLSPPLQTDYWRSKTEVSAKVAKYSKGESSKPWYSAFIHGFLKAVEY